MGDLAHTLGPKKLRKLRRKTGLPFDKAFHRNGRGGGRITFDNSEEGFTCWHYRIDFKTYEVEWIEDPCHWSSCGGRNG